MKKLLIFCWLIATAAFGQSTTQPQRAMYGTKAEVRAYPGLARVFIVTPNLATSGLRTQETFVKDPNDSTSPESDSVIVANGGVRFKRVSPTTGTVISTAAWGDITGKPSTFTPASHTQAISTIIALQDSLNTRQKTISLGTSGQYYRGDKTWATLDKSAVGLGNVPNTDATNASNLGSGSIPTGRFAVRTIPNTAIAQSGATDGQTIKWSTSLNAWIPAADNTGGSPAWGAVSGSISSQIDLQAALDAKVATTRNIIAGTGLTGGGSMSADRTLSIANDGVTNSKLDNMPQRTIKGRGVSSGTGDPTDIDMLDLPVSTAQQTAIDTKHPKVTYKQGTTSKGSAGSIVKVKFSGNGITGMANAGDSLTITIKKDYVTLEEFGGAADGTTDNYAAFNSAKAAGKKILLGPGVYATSRTWLIDSDTFELMGSGKFVTRIIPLSSFNRTVDSSLVRVGSSAYRPANVTIRDLHVSCAYGSDGNDVSALMLDADYNIDIINCWFQGGNYITRNTGGVYIRQSKHLRFTDCNFTNSYTYAVYVRGQAYDDTSFRGCQFDESQADIVVINTGYFQDLRLFECSFGHSYDASVGYQTPIRHTLIKNTTSGGINNLMITNCTFGNSMSSPTNTAIDLISTTGYVLIQGNQFFNYKKWAIIKKGSGAIYVLDNDFKGNGRSKGLGTVYTDVVANNEDASPYFYGDMWVSDGGYYGGRIANNQTDQTNGILVCARPTSNDIAYQNVKYENNKAYTHGRIVGVPEYGTAAPSSGSINYLKGEYVINSNPSEVGSTPNKYIIKGWICITTGYPGTWLQDRALTGN